MKLDHAFTGKTDMSQPPPPAPKPHPDRYVKHILIGCGLLILLMVAVFAGGMAMLYKSVAKMAPRADKILAEVRDGSIDQLYEESDSFYKSNHTKAQHDAMFAAIDSKLGKLESWGIRNGATLPSANGKTSVIMLGAKFEKGSATIVLNLVQPSDDAEFKLHEFHIDSKGLRY
jgi:hypothetical protein